jgi:tetratricopeptide (TPR) repeat protein
MQRGGKILPGIFFLVLLVPVLFIGFWTSRFLISDLKLADSLLAAQQNKGQQTYNLQVQAISNFPYRSDAHRLFSQVNLALANSLSANIPQGSSPSAQTQQTIFNLIQQSINSGRNAVNLSPLTAANWENLSQIYRSLINVGQNAEQFAILSLNRAIALDPYNPQLYVSLGGIYYALGQYDNAQSQFQAAVNLKPDFANAHYNLGHALEAKGDLKNALAEYETVKSLVKDNKENLQRITSEIEALQKRLGSAQPQAPKEKPVSASPNQPPLQVSTPSASLPEHKPPINIPEPPLATQGAR